MWLGVALIVWLWGLALYLLAYYVALWTWGAAGLHERLGQDLYNAHVPTGGWTATVVPTLVFLITLAVVAAARRPIEAAVGWLSKRVRLPQRATRVGASLALMAMTVPLVHAGVVATQDEIDAALDRSRRAEAERRAAERLAHDPFHTGDGLAGPVTTYVASRRRLHLASDGTYRYSYSSWCGSCPRGRVEWLYGRDGDVLVLGQKPGEDTPGQQLREVRWGDRLYLIDTGDFESFTNAVNAGREPRTTPDGIALLRLGDEQKPATGQPELPADWQGFLLSQPLEGRTLEVADDGTTWIDLGAEQGVRVGMRLFASGSPVPIQYAQGYGDRKAVVQSLEIVDVEARRCRGKAGDGPGWTVPAGLLVTSREPSGD